MRNQAINGAHAARVLEAQEKQLHEIYRWGLMDEKSRKQIRDMAAQKHALASRLRAYDLRMNS